MSKPATDRVLTTTVRGSSDDIETADQNAVAVRHGPLVGATIVAIAGGHGQTRGPRSHIGARIAADVAATNAEAAVAALPSPDAAALAALGDVLAARIVEQWQTQVRDLIAAQPPVDDDAVDENNGRPDADPLSAYGTGLLLAIVTPAAVLALQLGEGDIALRSGDGETVQPLAVDVASDSSEADSLALADAQSHFRHAAADRTARDVTLVLLAAGLDRTTADPDWPATFAADLDAQAEEHGIDSLEEQLPGRLGGTVHGGDDVTVALVFPAAPATVVPAATVTGRGLATTIANPAVAAGAATAAAPAVTTRELPAVTAPATARRRPWMMAAVTAGVALLAIGLVLALSRDKGSTTPATTVTTTKPTATSTTVRTTTSTSPSPSSAAPSSAPSTTPPPTTLPAAVTVPPTAAPPRTTAPAPPPTTSPPPPTTVPVTASSTPTT